MRIKLSPSAVHSGAALASLLCAGKFKVGYFLDSPRTDNSKQYIWFWRSGIYNDGHIPVTSSTVWMFKHKKT